MFDFCRNLYSNLKTPEIQDVEKEIQKQPRAQKRELEAVETF